jgi:hypothetical protein
MVLKKSIAINIHPKSGAGFNWKALIKSEWEDASMSL